MQGKKTSDVTENFKWIKKSILIPEEWVRHIDLISWSNGNASFGNTVRIMIKHFLDEHYIDSSVVNKNNV